MSAWLRQVCKIPELWEVAGSPRSLSPETLVVVVVVVVVIVIMVIICNFDISSR